VSEVLRELGRPIRVVLFTGGPVLDPGAAAFAERLDAHPEIELAAVVRESRGEGLGAVVRDLWRRRGLLAAPLLALRVLGRVAHPCAALRERRVRRALAGRHRVVPRIHAPEVLEGVRALEPDLGLIYGSPILRPVLFGIPRLGTLGIHHGSLPRYRGKKTTFWAIYHGEPSAGVTIQRVNDRLDAGEIVAEGEVVVGRLPLAWVWRRLEALGLELYVEAVLAVKRGTARFEPPRAGVGGLFKDPGPRDIAIFWWRSLGRLARGAPPSQGGH
jgi:folate-dependent phosphoribosylglycinamide formyltransferase PurN